MMGIKSSFKRMGRSTALIGWSIFVGLSATSVAGPIDISFSTGGTTYSTNGATQDPAGNVLAVGAGSILSNLTIGQTSQPFQVLFQSQLVFNSSSTNLALSTPGLFTVTGSLMETATLTANGTAAFNLAAGPSNFSIYYNNTGSNLPNSLAGTGFQSGSLIFAGSIAGAAGNFADQNAGGQPVIGTFDTVSNAYGAKQTVLGTGNNSLTVLETSYDSSFFNTNLTGATLSLTISTNSQFVTAGAEPSMNFFGTTPNLPTINGLVIPGVDNAGPYDFQFQSNGSGSFAIPEPASIAMTMMGLSGVGFAASRSRRRKTAIA